MDRYKRVGNSYPAWVKVEALQRARNGEPKFSVAKRMGINYVTILRWTYDINRERGGYVREGTVKILRQLVEKGYYFGALPTANKKALRKHFPVKFAVVRGKKHRQVLYLKGREKEAFWAFVRSTGMKTIGYHELSFIGRAFGMKGKMLKKSVKDIKEHINFA